jgi:hypothetical protein
MTLYDVAVCRPQLDPFDEIRAECEPDGAPLVSVVFLQVCVGVQRVHCRRCSRGHSCRCAIYRFWMASFETPRTSMR